ncbi:TPA: LamG-like jellyroll fold domain-containing protein [Clostridium botulinum]|uniref:LamG-like jellyroll fold domain-containing protein n=2 Tax=Clostridium botulinum TaxID=1491 RepID=UPI0004676551|nr:LamG-like jellyroll fold domain-containing protein [Clostridium botulinum]APH20967.1 concanavalin A-like lectin/glucanases superfamily protein [Clostridium botulinum]APQ71245.1 concanavalin A-like lectin/glucanases superfamily protein [Clostridium botulinum]APR02316.1 concanavalin A-like lectin/glucanases superfamily protein [Clostridium botulinum]
MAKYIPKKDYSHNLIAKYNFEETSGNICIDSTGKYNGAYVGTTSIVGIDGNARSFNGESDCINFNNSIIPLGKKSVKFRIRLQNNLMKNQNVIFYVGNDNYKNSGSLQCSYLRDAQEIRFASGKQDSSGSWQVVFDLKYKCILTDSKWHDILLTFDNNISKMYIDDLINPVEQMTKLTDENISYYNRNFSIGGLVDSKEYCLKGLLDNFEIYNEVIEFTNKKYLINQNENYYSINSNFLNLGQPIDNTQLENWYNKYGADDVNIITQNLNNKEFPMTKNESGIWETDFQLDMNDVADNIDLVDMDENNKSIKYNCNDYRIIDLCDDEFDIRMLKEK